MKVTNENSRQSPLHFNINYSKDNYNSTTTKNFVDKDAVSMDSSMNDISEYMNNIREDNYKEFIKEKYDIIIRFFNEIDKNNDSYVDYDEMLNYLNKGMSVYSFIILERTNF